jgi:hypothetical protein
VSDETLRDLERRAKASPTDAALGHELVRALERGGKNARAVEELLRIGGLGDRDARERLERQVAPCPNLNRVGTRRGPGRLEGARLRRATFPVEETPWLRGATDDLVLLGHGDALVAVDATSLKELWRRPRVEMLAAAALPDGVLFVEDQALVLVDRAGAERKLATVEGSVLALGGLGDRGVVATTTGRDHFLACLDLGTGKVVWRQSLDYLPRFMVEAGRIFLCGSPVRRERSTRIEVRDLVSGAALARLDDQTEIGASDPAGFFAASDTGLRRFDRDGSATSWPVPVGHYDRMRTWHERVLVFQHGRLDVLRYPESAVQWSLDLEAGEWGGRDACFAGEHVWVALAKRSGEHELRALGVDDGICAASWPMPIPAGPVLKPRVVPLDGAIVVVAPGKRRVHLHRLEEG